MKRNISILKDHKFDAVVIGGGIHGTTAFHQLAKTGVRVALIEKGDFGEATSANSLKILHGGLRYLQHLNFSRMRESIRSRHHFMEIAPQLIKPMPCLMPTYGIGMQSKLVMGIAIKIFDLIGWDRNKNAPDDRKVKPGRLLTKQEILKIAPGVNPEGLTGAACWYDDMILSTERMSLSFVKEGCDLFHGTAANYCKAEEILKDRNKICGVRVSDVLSGETFTISTDLVINAAGPWAGTIDGPGKITSSHEDLAKAVNIVVNRPLFNGYGIGMAGTSDYADQDAVIKRGNRLYFFAPWKDQTIIGTTYRYYRGDNDKLAIEQEDIDEILQEVNGIYPIAKLTKDDITFCHVGLSPAHQGVNYDHSTTPQMVKHSKVIDHAEYDGVKGLFTLEGVKYTTAPEMARQLLKMLKEQNILKTDSATLNQPHACRKVSLSQANITRYSKLFPHVMENHGKFSGSVYQIMEDIPESQDQLGEEGAFLTKAEIIHAVEEEMAIHLADLILRRTNIATAGCPDEPFLMEGAKIMAEMLKWSEEERYDEIKRVTDYFGETLGITPTQIVAMS